MKSIRNISLILLLALICCAPGAFAQNTTMYFNGGFQGAVWCGGPEGCAGTGFYDGSVNNTPVGPSTPSTPGYVCDDYWDNVSAGQTWSANGINVATLNSSNIGQTLFGQRESASAALSLYAELAFLVNQMFTTPNLGGATQASYSEALWYLTSLVWSPGSGKQLSLASLDPTAQGFVSAALTHASDSLSKYANLWIYTPYPTLGPQEMWGDVAVAEGGAAALYLLFATFSCFGGMFFRSRRAKTQAGIA